MPPDDARPQALTSTPAPLEIERVEATGSTSSDLLARLRSWPDGVPLRPLLRIAVRQSAGRGRLGRSWQATPGASLTCSFAWPLGGRDPAGLSLALGVALAEAIDPAPAEGARLRIGVKWPNDLWLVGPGEPGRKLGGILVETTPVGAARAAVIGIGINVLRQDVEDASSGVAWLAEIEPGATPETLLARIVPAVLDALARFERDGFAGFAERFAARDLLRGRTVRLAADTAGAGGTRTGSAAGVGADGRLRVQTRDGWLAVGSGEVELAPGARAQGPAC